MKIKYLFLAAIFFTLSSFQSNGATYTVTNTNDKGAGSLRGAVSVANATAADDVIVFDISGCPDGVCRIMLTSGELVIGRSDSGRLTISSPSGPGNLIISGNDASRIFSTPAGSNLTLDGLTMEDGFTQGQDGGAIRNLGSLTVSNSVIRNNWGNGYGGGISSRGTLVVTRSEITGNSAPNGFPDAYGGGIYSDGGSILIHDSTIAGNYSVFGGGMAFFALSSSLTVVITNSTVSGNYFAYGGGMFLGISSADSVRVTNSTFTMNSDSGISVIGSGHLFVRNSILAGNEGPDVYFRDNGILENLGNNLIGGSPLLGPLANNGGPTRTNALLPGSPAINAGNNCILTANGCGDNNPALATDQRGIGRVGAVDIGAFEFAPGSAPFDFDGDRKSDVSVFRPSNGTWYLNRSTDGFVATPFGLSTDQIVPADYDGDAKTDIAIFRDGTWWRINSSNSTVTVVQFGVFGDIPLPGDYNGDGRDELAVYRNGEWWISGSGRMDFGLPTDEPVPADYDGDGKIDIAIYRQGAWWRINSGNSAVNVVQFGLVSDRPASGDYDGDSKADHAVYRGGTWYLLRSSQGFVVFQFGIDSDIPAPADYDGDGRTDAAIFRKGTWWIANSTGGVSTQQFGLEGDRPVPNAFVP